MTIVEAMKSLEENNMWISSLKANPECDEPVFVTIVWDSLHTLMSQEYDDELGLKGHVHDKNSQKMKPRKRVIKLGERCK